MRRRLQLPAELGCQRMYQAHPEACSPRLCARLDPHPVIGDDEFVGVKVIFEKDNLEKTLGEVISSVGRKQIRIAETEKYPHVTFFFSGGREEPFPGEKRLLCPSPKEMVVLDDQGVEVTIPVKTYDQIPEMAAYDIRNAIIPELEKEETDFICLNFANTDMVGHTGVFEAVVKAAETADACAQARLLPEDLTERLSGRRVLSRLRAGEPAASVVARLARRRQAG